MKIYFSKDAMRTAGGEEKAKFILDFTRYLYSCHDLISKLCKPSKAPCILPFYHNAEAHSEDSDSFTFRRSALFSRPKHATGYLPAQPTAVTIVKVKFRRKRFSEKRWFELGLE